MTPAYGGSTNVAAFWCHFATVSPPFLRLIDESVTIASTNRRFFATAPFSHQPTYVGCIAGCGLLSARRGRDSRSASSWMKKRVGFVTISTRITQGRCMARGRTTSLTIHLTPSERRTLLAWQRATTIPAGLARRGRILLLRADGMTITAIARTVGLSRQQVYKWIHRFMQEGLEGLHAKPSPGHRLGPLPQDLREQRDMDAG